MQVVSRLLREPAPVMGSAGYDACSGHEKMISQLILQILIPTGLLGVLWRSRFRSRSEWLLSILVLGSILLFSFATARWDWFSYYLRILPVPLFLILSYSAYGQMENRIKEQQLDLFADRTSAHTMRANQLRAYLSAFAGVVIQIIRMFGLKATRLARAQAGTIRTRLLKIAGSVRVTTRKIWVLLSSVYPWRELFKRVARNLPAAAEQLHPAPA